MHCPNSRRIDKFIKESCWCIQLWGAGISVSFWAKVFARTKGSKIRLWFPSQRKLLAITIDSKFNCDFDSFERNCIAVLWRNCKKRKKEKKKKSCISVSINKGRPYLQKSLHKVCKVVQVKSAAYKAAVGCLIQDLHSGGGGGGHAKLTCATATAKPEVPYCLGP